MLELLSTCELPMVLDADALNAVTELAALRKVPVAGAARVLTPHPGELSRLLDIDVAAIQGDRVAAVRHAAEVCQCVVVLKGRRTLVAEPSGAVWVNPTGGPGLATGGTGDVLAGAIGALLAQGLGGVDSGLGWECTCTARRAISRQRH